MNSPIYVQSKTKSNYPFNLMIFNGLFLMLNVNQILSIIFLSSGNDNIIRISNYLFYIIGVFLAIVSILTNKKDFKSKIFLVGMLFLAIIDWMIYGLNLAIFTNYLNFYLMMTIWIVSDTIKISKKNFNMFAISIIIQSFVLIVVYFSPRAYFSYQEYVKVSSTLTLGFSNPNETGIILFSTIVPLTFLNKTNKNKIFNVIISIIIVILIYFLILTDARTSMVCCFLFLFLVKMTQRLNIRNTNTIKLIVLLCLLMPCFFVLFYIRLSNIVNVNDIVFIGKKLISGRQRVYEKTFLDWNNIFFGNMQTLLFSNSHNGFLTILANNGLICFVLYMIYIYDKLVSIELIFLKKQKKSIGIIAIFMIFIMASTESSVLVGGTIFYYYTFIFCYIYNYELKFNNLGNK